MPEAPAPPFDILPPPAPPALPVDHTWLIVGGMVCTLAVVVLVLRQAWRMRHRRRAHNALRRAEAAHRAGTLGAQEAAFAIARALMQGLGTRHLRAGADAPAEWRDFVARLDTLRYTTQTTDVMPLFAQARYWLRRPRSTWQKAPSC